MIAKRPWLIGYKSTLVPVMAWYHQASRHYLSQCWPRSNSMSPYGITRPQLIMIQTPTGEPMAGGLVPYVCKQMSVLTFAYKYHPKCLLTNVGHKTCKPKSAPMFAWVAACQIACTRQKTPGTIKVYIVVYIVHFNRWVSKARGNRS